MMIRELVKKNRSYRRFYQDVEIDYGTLEELVDLARMSASGANLQPLRYILSNTPEKNDLIFQHLKWAAYLKDWDGPCKGERPSAYIVMLGEKSAVGSKFFCDHGIASQSILLGATEKGLGGCNFLYVDRESLKSKLNVPDNLEILLVIALGKPKETVVMDEIEDNESIKYWRDENGVHHVPKRKLKDIILKL